jgi:hypothetical protein
MCELAFTLTSYTGNYLQRALREVEVYLQSFPT